MKTRDQINEERETFRAGLAQMLCGPNAEINRRQLELSVGLKGSCFTDDPYKTAYNLGKFEAICELIQEAESYARQSS
jgi:hypothetical protein